jgi:hypothetical protein
MLVHTTVDNETFYYGVPVQPTYAHQNMVSRSLQKRKATHVCLHVPHDRTGFFLALAGLGSEPGISLISFNLSFHHFTAEPERFPRGRLDGRFVNAWRQ